MTGIIRCESTPVLILFLKTNVFYTYNTFLINMIVPNFSIKIIRNFFIKPFIKFFKTLVFTRYGLYSNNFIKSLSYHTIKTLVDFTPKIPYISRKVYLHPIAILNFSFHKNTYNTLIIYILYLVTHIYLNNFTNFYL